MTTAARPTWAPAKGGQEQGGARMFGPSQKFSARDLASHTVLKTRKDGQGTVDELRKKDLLAELEDRERQHFNSKEDEPLLAPKPGTEVKLIGFDDPDKKPPPKNIDADDSDDEDEKSDSENDDDDDDDEAAALIAELERIKKDRAEEKMRKEAVQRMEDAKAREAEAMRGNPLLDPQALGGQTLKRRWDDDVPFKNQARGEPKQQKRFVNDTIRNDFHRKFLNKYMK